MPAFGNSMNLKNKTAIITGGTKGIGRGIAEALILEGLSLCISARHQDEIDKAVSELNELGGGRALGFVCDVRQHDQVRALIDHTVKELGGLDILINNAASVSSRRSNRPRPKIFAQCSKRICLASFTAVTKRSRE